MAAQPNINSHQKLILSLVEEGSKIIDIGCGRGGLLKLFEAKNITCHGLDIESDKVSSAVANGLSVIQGDADSDLQYYGGNGFDYAIMALSLQSMKQPKQTLREALRIAKKTIIVIPNFGHWKNRYYFLTRGCMPVTDSLSFQWYETPNIHFCTIKDFVTLTKQIDCQIEQRFYINSSHKVHKFGGNGAFNANLFAEYGVFVLSA